MENNLQKMGDWFYHNQHKMAIDKNTDRNLNGSWRTEEFRPIKSRANFSFFQREKLSFLTEVKAVNNGHIADEKKC